MESKLSKICGCLVVVIAIGLSAQAQQEKVRTSLGIISGIANGDASVTSFKGIRYAAPPVGSLRWRPPKPVSPWKGVLKADHFGSSCMQGPNTEFGPYTKEFLYVTPTSEDCLFLNVWTPKPSKKAKLPVIVFIHGGAFSGGSGDVPVYDGEQLARSGVVVVTINYRVGALGFLAHPDLSAESEHHVSGNYGLLDQIEALRWVKRNVSAFGGDPTRVTIAGQSAGALSVAALLASPLAQGLFSAAIADSGIGGRGIPAQMLADAEKAGVKFAASKKAESMEALRKIPAKDLVGFFWPNVDGWLLPDQPMVLTTQAGKDNDVPVITGFNEGDTKMMPSGSVTAAAYRERARKTYKSFADEFLKLYQGNTDEEARQSEETSGHDRVRSGAFLWANSRAKTHKSQVYIYYFDHAIPWPAHPEFGAFHTSEIPYAFGTLGKLERPWNDGDFKLSRIMMTYWKNMAAKGDPNGPGVPHWNYVGQSGSDMMWLREKCESIIPADEAKVNFWKRYFESPDSLNAFLF